MDLRTIGLALSEVSGDARKDLERNQSRFTGGTVISSGGHLVGLHVLYGRKANPLGIALALDARRAFHIPRYFWKTSVKANGPLRTATGQFDSGSVQRNDPCQTNIQRFDRRSDIIADLGCHCGDDPLPNHGRLPTS